MIIQHLEAFFNIKITIRIKVMVAITKTNMVDNNHTVVEEDMVVVSSTVAIWAWEATNPKWHQTTNGTMVAVEDMATKAEEATCSKHQ